MLKIKRKSLFDHVNQVTSVQNPNYWDNISDEEILELAISAGAEDCLSNDLYHEVITTKDSYYRVKLELEKKILDFISSGIEWLPVNKISLDKEKTKSVINFLEALRIQTN